MEATEARKNLALEMVEACGLDIRQLVQDLTNVHALLSDHYRCDRITPDPEHGDRYQRIYQARSALGMGGYPYTPEKVPAPVEAPPTPSLQDKLNSLTERVYRLEQELSRLTPAP